VAFGTHAKAKNALSFVSKPCPTKHMKVPIHLHVRPMKMTPRPFQNTFISILEKRMEAPTELNKNG